MQDRRRRRSDGREVPIKVKSLVGLIPVTGAAEYHYGLLGRLPDFAARAEWYVRNKPRLAEATHSRGSGPTTHRLLCVVPPERLQAMLAGLFDEAGTLSPYGIRSVSAWHRDHPFEVSTPQGTATTDYAPAVSTTGMFGGNSNWRGPICFPLNTLLVEALRDYDSFDPGEITVEYPAGSGRQVGLGDIADDLSRRLVVIFLRDDDGRRPVHGTYDLLATDTRWRDTVPFPGTREPGSAPSTRPAGRRWSPT